MQFADLLQPGENLAFAGAFERAGGMQIAAPRCRYSTWHEHPRAAAFEAARSRRNQSDLWRFATTVFHQASLPRGKTLISLTCPVYAA